MVRVSNHSMLDSCETLDISKLSGLISHKSSTVAIIMPILKTRKLRCKDIKQFANNNINEGDSY